jgi:hypothetical protein
MRCIPQGITCLIGRDKSASNLRLFYCMGRPGLDSCESHSFRYSYVNMLLLFWEGKRTRIRAWRQSVDPVNLLFCGSLFLPHLDLDRDGWRKLKEEKGKTKHGLSKA